MLSVPFSPRALLAFPVPCRDLWCCGLSPCCRRGGWLSFLFFLGGACRIPWLPGFWGCCVLARWSLDLAVISKGILLVEPAALGVLCPPPPIVSVAVVFACSPQWPTANDEGTRRTGRRNFAVSPVNARPKVEPHSTRKSHVVAAVVLILHRRKCLPSLPCLSRALASPRVLWAFDPPSD